MATLRLFSRALGVVVLCATCVLLTQARSPVTLVNFYGNNGVNPDAPLIQGADGNLYGTTFQGGANNGYQGTVFQVTLAGTLTTLYSFTGPPSDGDFPYAGLVQGLDRSFYGTTQDGGVITSNCSQGCGTIFKMAPSGTVIWRYYFHGTDGAVPDGGLIQGSDGYLYGTTSQGGTGTNCAQLQPPGCGTFYKISPAGVLTTLHNFNYIDGYQPGPLIQGWDGNFYGTTSEGIVSSQVCGFGCGTIFRATPAGRVTTLYAFDGTEGIFPRESLIQASDGNLYGTTSGGGTGSNCPHGWGCGTIFQISPASPYTLTTLHVLNGADGYNPNGGLVQGSDGYLYGTTNSGGANSGGTIFRVTLGGTFSTLYNFCSLQGCLDGNGPSGTLLQATNGVFYGMTFGGGAFGPGTVFSFDEGLGVPLSVTLVGGGSVKSSEGYINCGTVCSADFRKGVTTNLAATAASGTAFKNWTGCDSVHANTCSITVNATRAVTAHFVTGYVLAATPSGSGTIISGDGNINCGTACSYSYPSGTSLLLTALPAVGATLSNWTGCTSTAGDTCRVTINAAKSVTAAFASSPVSFASLSLNPSTIHYGTIGKGTLTFASPAPSGGVTLRLTSSQPEILSVPSSIYISGGHSVVQFGARVLQTRRATVTVTATDGTSSISFVLNVVPAQKQSSSLEIDNLYR